MSLLALECFPCVHYRQGACQAYVQAALGSPAQAAGAVEQQLDEGDPAQADAQPEATTEDLKAGLDGSGL